MKLNWFEFSKGCAKGLLLTLNGLCILFALCTLGFAVVDMRILKQYGEEQSAGTFASDMIIIAASLLLIAVAVFGCVGAARDNVKILYLYVGFIMILVLLELLIAIYVGVQRYGLEFKVTDWMREDFFRNMTGESLNLHNKLWDNLQSDYECCGLNGPEDYLAMKQEISMSCCPRAYRARSDYVQKQLYKNCIETATYYTEGCEEEVLFAIRESADCLLGVAVICFWFEAAGMLLAMWVANNLKHAVQVYKHPDKY